MTDHHTIKDDGWITLHSSPPIMPQRCDDCRRPRPGPHQSWCPMQDEGDD